MHTNIFLSIERSVLVKQKLVPLSDAYFCEILAMLIHFKFKVVIIPSGCFTLYQCNCEARGQRFITSLFINSQPAAKTRHEWDQVP